VTPPKNLSETKEGAISELRPAAASHVTPEAGFTALTRVQDRLRHGDLEIVADLVKYRGFVVS